MALSRDISTGGMSLIHTEEVQDKLLVVELPITPGQKTQVVLEVLRCRSIGQFYEVGGRFVSKLL